MSFAINDSCVESLSAVAAQHEDWIIRQAIVLLEKRIFKAGPCLSRPAAVRDYLRVKLVAEPNEIFAAVFLDSMHQVLAYEPLFRGTINSTSVYPRVVVQRVLELNAAAVVFAHYVARNIMRIMCPVFLCGRALETWHTAMVSKHWLGT
ncbi:JAB domain-containing protein [Pseudomonas aeruginosa]|uniref:JAB domain-containing protein n=3 Tax=Pseudomonas aeruginosa TaxID=287 RepID=UPI003D6706A7